ncbi:helix-turn-helix domain-containing protein [Bradyrhizobium sp. 76]|nr:helix-turn-helix domain-containing protein [Bradyrhizobium sp. 76]
MSPAVGVRWFRRAGGIRVVKTSVRALSLVREREEIALLRAQGHGVRTIARQLKRPACRSLVNSGRGSCT